MKNCKLPKEPVLMKDIIPGLKALDMQYKESAVTFVQYTVAKDRLKSAKKILLMCEIGTEKYFEAVQEFNEAQVEYAKYEKKSRSTRDQD